MDPEESCFGSKHLKLPSTMNDKYNDLSAIVRKIPKKYAEVIVKEEIRRENPTIGELKEKSLRLNVSI
jgi:hypothetical protein